jgi:hypothetical protein
MNVINSYNQLPIGRLQENRLYLQSKPLVRLWRQLKKNLHTVVPDTEKLLACELEDNYIELDCGGWIYADQNNKQCIAIEMFEQSKHAWNPMYFEYDYLTWHPNYLPDWPVLAYYSTYFKYSSLDDFVNFCQLWSHHHHKVIVGLDPTKVKLNYLKYDLKKIIANSTDLRPRVLIEDYQHLVFVLER